MHIFGVLTFAPRMAQRCISRGPSTGGLVDEHVGVAGFANGQQSKRRLCFGECAFTPTQLVISFAVFE